MPSRVRFSAALAVLALAAAATPAAAHRCRGQVVDLGTLPDDPRSVALATNADHVVVGYSTNAEDTRWRAFRWANGHMQALPLPAPGNNEATDINASGTIVGRMHQTGNGDDERGFAWRDGRLTTLPGLPGGTGHTQARAINSLGVIGGSAWNAAGQERAALWILAGSSNSAPRRATTARSSST